MCWSLLISVRSMFKSQCPSMSNSNRDAYISTLDYGTIHFNVFSNTLSLCFNGSKHNEPQFVVLNDSVVRRVTFTISDDEEDEGFVAEQPKDWGCIRVALRRDLPSRGLSEGGRDLWTLLKHWQKHKNTNLFNHQNSSALIWVQFHCVTGHYSSQAYCQWKQNYKLFSAIEIKIKYAMKNLATNWNK